MCAYGATKAFVEATAAAFARDVNLGCPTVALRFGWCPRTADDVAAMRSVLARGAPDEFLSPVDAATSIAAAATTKQVVVGPSEGSSERFGVVFVQSLPGCGRGRFDMAPTTRLLEGWRPTRTFPDGIDELVRTRPQHFGMDAKLRPRRTESATRAGNPRRRGTGMFPPDPVAPH